MAEEAVCRVCRENRFSFLVGRIRPGRKVAVGHGTVLPRHASSMLLQSVAKPSRVICMVEKNSEVEGIA